MPTIPEMKRNNRVLCSNLLENPCCEFPKPTQFLVNIRQHHPSWKMSLLHSQLYAVVRGEALQITLGWRKGGRKVPCRFTNVKHPNGHQIIGKIMINHDKPLDFGDFPIDFRQEHSKTIHNTLAHLVRFCG